MPALVLLNPAARGGRNRHLRAPLAQALARAGLEAEIAETTARGNAERLARQAGARGRLVVVAGGDGTVHEAVNGLDGTGGRLAVLPLGTGNDFARALGMPRGLDDAVRALATAPTRRIDLGRLSWTDADGAHERAFANCVGVGFDAHAAALASETKWLGGRAAYLAAVLRTLWVWRRPVVEVRVQTEAHARRAALAGAAGGLEPAGSEQAESEPAGAGAAPGGQVDYSGPLFLCEVGNGQSMGGGFFITPDARLDDGLLDVCLARHLTPRRALGLLPQTFTGRHTAAPEVTMARARRLSLAVTASAAGGVGVQADGETLTYRATGVRVEVDPGALAVVAPAGGFPVATAGYDSYHSAPGNAPHAPRT